MCPFHQWPPWRAGTTMVAPMATSYSQSSAQALILLIKVMTHWSGRSHTIISLPCTRVATISPSKGGTCATVSPLSWYARSAFLRITKVTIATFALLKMVMRWSPLAGSSMDSAFECGGSRKALISLEPSTRVYCKVTLLSLRPWLWSTSRPI